LPVQKLDPVVFGQNAHFGKLIEFADLELSGCRLHLNTKEELVKSYEAFRRSATEFWGKLTRKQRFGIFGK
jgi:hypothetical protein